MYCCCVRSCISGVTVTSLLHTAQLFHIQVHALTFNICYYSYAKASRHISEQKPLNLLQWK